MAISPVIVLATASLLGTFFFSIYDYWTVLSFVSYSDADLVSKLN